MIEHYSFGSITISGKRYTSDLKINNGQVYPDWWRKTGHSVDIDDVTDILNSKPGCLIIGSGNSGLMKVSVVLRELCADNGMELIIEPTSSAVGTFNRMSGDGKKVAAGFHLTC